MSFWHLTPAYILHEMTEEQMVVLFGARDEWERASAKASSAEPRAQEPRRISAEEFFQRNGIVVAKA